jgi:putative transposase
LAAADVRESVASSLGKVLDPFAPGRIVDLPMVLDVLMYAAATRGSIHSACAALEGSADDNTVREYINDLVTVEQLGALEDAVNGALVTDLPRKVRRGRWEVACDAHDQPFYGRSPELMAMTCRGKAHDGTTRFFRIATACVLADGLRVTLAIKFVRPGETMPEVLEQLLERVKAHGVGIRRLFADKGFASIEVYRLLERHEISAIIACPIRGKSGGSRALCRGSKS